MLHFLQTGKVLYVLAGICLAGIISKLVTGNLYKRLMKEIGNMALTKNKNLRALKQKTENMILVSQGIRNPVAYIERQMYGFRFMNLSLDAWDNLSVQAMILCFLVGGAAAFGSYWYRCDSYYIVLYGTMGILSGLFLVFVDNGVNTTGKRQQLADYLVDYVENSPHFYRTVDKTLDNRASALSRAGIRTIGRKNRTSSEESAAGEDAGISTGNDAVRESRNAAVEGKESKTGLSSAAVDKLATGKAHRQKQNRKFSVLKKSDRKDMEKNSIQAETSVQDGQANGDELTRSISYLKQSLDQIAASRESGAWEEKSSCQQKNEGLDKAKKQLKPEDIQLLGEILQEYLT